MNHDLARFHECGYVVVPKLFHPAEIAHWRDCCERFPDHEGDLLSHPALSSLVTDPRLLSMARELGIHPPVYFGHSSVSYYSEGYGLHRDMPNAEDFRSPEWSGDDYPILRMAIYLQDYSAFGGGLEVVPGSHRQASHSAQDARYLNTSAGDLVIWNLRLIHSGYGGRDLPLQPMPRRALFIVYARPDPLTDRYLVYLKMREYQVRIWRRSIYHTLDIRRGAAAGLLIRDIRKDIERVPGLGRHSGPVPLPYAGP